MIIDILSDLWYTDYSILAQRSVGFMKIYPEQARGEEPQDSLSVYLALQKRVANLERELEFTKLTINALYLEIKSLKKGQLPDGEESL